MDVLTVSIRRHGTKSANCFRVFAQRAIMMWAANKWVVRLHIRAFICSGGW